MQLAEISEINEEDEVEEVLKHTKLPKEAELHAAKA
jgi:hypothetical protein